VVEAPHIRESPPQSVEASAAFAIVNGFAEHPGFPEVPGFEFRPGILFDGTSGSPGRRRAISTRSDRTDIFGQPHLGEMARLAAFQHV
jgi:hypothetical protein